MQTHTSNRLFETISKRNSVKREAVRLLKYPIQFYEACKSTEKDMNPPLHS